MKEGYCQDGAPIGFCDLCVERKALELGLVQVSFAGNARGMHWIAGDWVDPILLREYWANKEK